VNTRHRLSVEAKLKPHTLGLLAVLPATRVCWSPALGAACTVSVAYTDPRTGLANARYLAMALPRELETAQRHGQPLAVLLMDLDGFKAINDQHGHLRGDAALQRVARMRIRTWMPTRRREKQIASTKWLDRFEERHQSAARVIEWSPSPIWSAIACYRFE
jgi:GGDEF domain-containing protein